MRIDEAVYLAAPKVKDAAMPTRRAFLIAGCTFSLGTAVGGACGYSLGAAAAPSTPTVEDELKPSGDVELDELRRLAIKAPLEELVQKRRVFLESLTIDYRTDAILWRGVERLTTKLLEDESFPDRRIFAKFLAQTIEYSDGDRRTRYADFEKQLRAIR